MALGIGIVGLPNVGKSTLFNALTKKSVPAENYPFCTIDPSVGVVAVPDLRLWKLSALSKSAKTIPAAIEFVDIAGLVKGASVGEGLGNKFLANIREVDAILEVVRIFPAQGGSASGGDVVHVYGEIDPMRDIEVINLELMMADLETVTKWRGNVEREVKRGDKNAVAEKAALDKISAALEAGRLAQGALLDEKESEIVRSLHLLTMKPILYALNKKSGAKNLDEAKDERWEKLTRFFKETNAQYVVFDAKVEDELKEFVGEEKEIFRKELGAEEGDGVDALISASYALLGLITYFTTG
ncbi:MAG: redox-regulated ATPase YchF, partial [Candidatus Lloydbacteria bacterium]|nr:redox-regulated ATPase YchF [Candidatus Lloydbacteria bacterium]